MKLWLIKQEVNYGWDYYDSAVVAAPDEESARKTSPGNHHSDDILEAWAAPEHVTATYIGEAAEGIIPTVILASFNAG